MQEEKNLIDHAQQSYGSETARALRIFFAKMKLPAPRAREYTVTNHKGYLVFLNPYGALLRIVSKEESYPDHPHILQPLKRFDARACRIEIMPGVDCPLSPEDMTELNATLKKDNIAGFDIGSLYNGGYLPNFKDENGKPFCVTVDNNSLRQLRASVEKIKQQLSRLPKTRIPAG